MWTCPRCDRTFGRANRPHACVPGMSVDDFFAGRPHEHRMIYEAIAGHLRELGDVIIEAVTVGIFFKRARNFSELRPRRDRRRQERLVLSLLMPRAVTHSKIQNKGEWSRYFVHHVDLREPDDVDEDVLEWLSEAYHYCPA